jgi:hypothetical protein
VVIGILIFSGLQFETVLLDVIRDPAERQLAIDCLVVIYWLSVNNPHVKMSSRPLEIMAILRDAVEEHWKVWCAQGRVVKESFDCNSSSGKVLKQVLDEIELGYEGNEGFARKLFFDLPASGREGSNTFLAASAIRIVFGGGLDLEHYDIESDFCEFIPRVRAGE